MDRIIALFDFVSIIIATEKHDEGVFHFHVGILNNNASRHTATKKLRGAFPEFEERQCNASFHKGWGTIFAYLTK